MGISYTVKSSWAGACIWALGAKRDGVRVQDTQLITSVSQSGSRNIIYGFKKYFSKNIFLAEQRWYQQHEL